MIGPIAVIELLNWEKMCKEFVQKTYLFNKSSFRCGNHKLKFVFHWHWTRVGGYFIWLVKTVNLFSEWVITSRVRINLWKNNLYIEHNLSTLVRHSFIYLLEIEVSKWNVHNKLYLWLRLVMSKIIYAHLFMRVFLAEITFCED